MTESHPICSECESPFFAKASPMAGLCMECAAVIYGYENCAHYFQDGRCLHCGWDGSRSDYVTSLTKEGGRRTEDHLQKALFVCGKARMRSPTAADLANSRGLAHADYAGLSNDADERLSVEHIEWADVILVMERRQKKRLTEVFGPHIGARKVRVLNIPDKYDYMDHALVEILTTKFRTLF